MKRIACLLLAAAMLGTATVAHAGTARVFCQHLGNLASPTDAQQTAYNNFLTDNSIDFGVFYGATSADFYLSADGYTAVTTVTGTYPGRTLVYKTAAWEPIHHYALEANTSYFMQNEAYVMQRKSTGEQFLLAMPTCTKDSGVGKASGPNWSISYINGKTNDYPLAKILVAMPYTHGLKRDNSKGGFWNTALTNNNRYVRTLTDNSAGSVYVKNDATLTYSGSAVTVVTMSGSDSKAAMATISWQMPCTITFEDWDGTPLATDTVLEGGDATPPAATPDSKAGYHFTGWNGPYQNVQASATLTAQYAINTYTVRFLDWDGTVLKSETVDHGSDATPPADPSRQGFRFTGWQGDYTGVTAATDITATYVEATAVTHFVTFLDWNGTQLSRQEILEGEDATPPADPDNRSGYHFTGWQGTYTNVQQDETVTAQYAINTYAVTFEDWDGAELKTETVEHGSDATPPANPTREGWHFTGWSGTYQNVQAATTITAQYEIDTFTVTFQYTNGVVISQQTVPYQGSATKPANPAPLDADALFYKWDGTYTSVTSDVDVFALFVPKVIKVGTGAELAEYMSTSDLLAMSGITIALTNDVSLSGVSYTARSLTATFDGRGHTISNIPGKFHLVSDIRGGTVRDVVFSGYRSPGNANQTQLVASQTYYNSTISGVVMTNCQWTVPNGSYGTAGFVYEVKQNTTITNCTMINCKVIGVNCGGSYKDEPQLLGGFVGKAASLTMVDCHFIVDNSNTVAIGDGISVAGAFVGKCSSGVTIERCSNNGRVAVHKQVYSAIGGAGGFVGIATSSGSPTIRECANFGIVESTVPAYPAGGFIGDAGSESGTFSLTFNDNFNYGAVSSPIAAGGLIGRYRGVVSQLRNSGNSGAISSEAGFAGGLVGQISYNDENKTWRIRNVMQAGAVSTVSGCAGLLIGCIEESDLAGLSMVVSNAVIAGSASISDGGQAGLLIGGRDITAANEIVFEVDDTCRVLASNASLAHYYDKANAPASLETAPDTMAAAELVNSSAKRRLNAAAIAGGWEPWVQGKEYPELARFGTKFEAGLVVMFF